jgi:hypothetical protein
VTTNRHEAPEPPETVRDRFRDPRRRTRFLSPWWHRHRSRGKTWCRSTPAMLGLAKGSQVIAAPVLHALNGHFSSVAGIGVLVTLSAATVTIALQTMFGVIGIGLTVVIFVILGNLSAGGAYQASLPPIRSPS